MKSLTQVPELDGAIAAHGRALQSGAPLDEFVSPEARESYRAAMQAVLKGGAISNFHPVGKARVGFQFISKVRFALDDRRILLLNRWRNEDGRWRITEVLDLSGKRSGWSGIETPPIARTENGHA